MSDLDKQLDKMQFAITRNMGIQAQFSQLRNFLQDEEEEFPEDFPPTQDLFDETTMDTGSSNGQAEGS